MFGFPKRTEVSKQLPKAAVYKKFGLSGKEKEKFDEDISRMYIVNEVNPETVNIAAGKSISSFYVIKVELKKKDFDEKNIIRLSKLIEQNMIFALVYENECKAAVYRSKLVSDDWRSIDGCAFEINGIDLDEAWDNLIMRIGSISVENGNTLEEQIAEDERKRKLISEIEKLEVKAKTEKQPKKKFELVRRIKELKQSLELRA